MTGGGLLNERGLTLVEVLLAVAVIGAAVAGVGVIVPIASYGIQDGSQLSAATFLAEQMVERARAATWTLEVNRSVRRLRWWASGTDAGEGRPAWAWPRRHSRTRAPGSPVHLSTGGPFGSAVARPVRAPG